MAWPRLPLRDRLGRRGERLAARHLRRSGHRIAARRLRLPGGEIDLLAVRGDDVVVIEVKTGRDVPFAELAARVTPGQARRLERVGAWLMGRPELIARPVRLDLVLVRLLGRRHEIEHRRGFLTP